MGLIGSICGTLYSQLDTSKMSKMSSCEAQASRVHCTTVVATCAVCRRVLTFVYIWPLVIVHIWGVCHCLLRVLSAPPVVCHKR